MQLRLGRPAGPEPEVARTKRRVGPATIISVVLHLLLGIALWRAIQMPFSPDRRWLLVDRPSVARERIKFVTVVPPVRVVEPPRSAGQRAPAPLVAPREVPSTIPAPVPGAPTPDPSVAPSVAPAGPLSGGTGPARGIQPAMVDPRIWVEDPTFIYAPKTPEERLDSALIASIKRKQDSIAANTYTPNKFERGDWTVEKDGKKYGIDPQYIRLGKWSIPTALLALLPFNRGGNPIEMERQRGMAAMRADIQYHAQVAMNEQEFRAAVRGIRDRKERERKAQTQSLPRRRSEPGVTVSPGDRPPD